MITSLISKSFIFDLKNSCWSESNRNRFPDVIIPLSSDRFSAEYKPADLKMLDISLRKDQHDARIKAIGFPKVMIVSNSALIACLEISVNENFPGE